MRLEDTIKELPLFEEQIAEFKGANELDGLKLRQKEVLAQLRESDEDKKATQEDELDDGKDSYAKEPVTNKTKISFKEAKEALENNRSTYKEIAYSKEKWDELFVDGKIDTPLGIVKIGANQFDKLNPNTKDPKNPTRKKQDRRKHISYIYETLKNPTFIIDNTNGKTIYIKEFDKIDSTGKSTRIYSSIVINKDGLMINISNHNMNHKQVYNEIKKGKLIFSVGVPTNKETNPNPTPTIVYKDSISKKELQNQEDKNDAYSRKHGYDEAGLNYVPTYKVTGLPNRGDNTHIYLGDREVKLPTLKEPMTADSVRVYLSNIIGARLYKGKIEAKSALGIYKRDDSSIRVKSYSDVEIMAHELAHYLDFFYKNKTGKATDSFFRKEILKNKDELKALSYTTKPNEVLREGFAEFVRLYLTNYNTLNNVAPNMLKSFEAKLARDKELQAKMQTLQDGMHQYYYQGDEVRLRAKQGGKLNKTAKKIQRSQAEIASDMRQKFIDKIHTIKRIEAKVMGNVARDAIDSPYKALQLVNGASGMMYGAMNIGVPKLDKWGGDIEYSGKPLNEIFKSITSKGEDRVRLFSDYLVAKRASELMEQGRENLITADEIDAGLAHAETYPEFEKAFEEYQEFNDGMLDFYVSMKLITTSQRENFKEMNKNYVPFHRIRDSVQSGVGMSQSDIGKKLTGGTHSLGNIMDNIISGVERNIKDALVSRGKSMFYEMLEDSGMGGVYATKISASDKLVKDNVYALAKKVAEIMAELGVTVAKDGQILSGDIDSDTIIDVEEIQQNLIDNPKSLEVWTHGHAPLSEDGGYVDSVIIDDKRVYFETKDKALVDSLTSFKPENYHYAVKAMASFKNFQTWGITNNPLFYLTNFVRDTVSASLISENGFIPFYSSIRGMYHFMFKTKVFKDFMSSGGGYGTKRTGDIEQSSMDMLKVNRGLDLVRKLATSLNYGADMFEYGTRLGEFELAQKAGKTNWQSAYEGREISTDFSISGSSRLAVGYMATVPFMKAGINGLDKTSRKIFELNGEMKVFNALKFKDLQGQLQKEKIKFYAMGSMLALATLWLYDQNKDDERYKRLTRDKKLMYWHFFVGEHHIQLPRPYDVGFIFSAMPEIAAQALYTQNGQEALTDFLWGAKNMFNIGGISGMLGAVYDDYTNTKWNGAPVISPFMDGADDKSDEFVDTTPLMYRKASKYVPLSPIKTQHYIDSIFGLNAKTIEYITEKMLWDEKSHGAKPFSQNSLEFLTYRFHGREVEPRTKWSEKYYKLLEDARSVKKSYDLKNKRGHRDDDKDFNAYINDPEKDLMLYINSDLTKFNDYLKDIKDDIEFTTYDPGLSKKKKEAKINSLYLERAVEMEKFVKETQDEIKKMKLLRQSKAK